MTTAIAVYADWDGMKAPMRLGLLHVRRGTSHEAFDFEYDPAALLDPILGVTQLDARIGLFAGRQHPAQGNETFGMFADSSPDRWGRMLMKRRLEREQRSGKAPKTARLHESDFPSRCP